MSDEAAPYYVDMVDQQTLGHQFLLKNFGADAIPKTGWQVLCCMRGSPQIDPFGHSSFMATLYALMGFNSWFFARSDYQVTHEPSHGIAPMSRLGLGGAHLQDWNTRAPIKNLETIMRPSASLGDTVNIFTGALPGYGAMCCDVVAVCECGLPGARC